MNLPDIVQLPHDNALRTQHASGSAEQREVEPRILRAFEAWQRVTFIPAPDALKGRCLDAYAAEPVPVLVEVFAHVGPSKPGQRKKITHDMAKLLLAEKRLGVPCRKVVAVIDANAVAHLARGWVGEFARAFRIEVLVVPGLEHEHEALKAAQKRQER